MNLRSTWMTSRIIILLVMIMEVGPCLALKTNFDNKKRLPAVKTRTQRNVLFGGAILPKYDNSVLQYNSNYLNQLSVPLVGSPPVYNFPFLNSQQTFPLAANEYHSKCVHSNSGTVANHEPPLTPCQQNPKLCFLIKLLNNLTGHTGRTQVIPCTEINPTTTNATSTRSTTRDPDDNNFGNDISTSRGPDHSEFGNDMTSAPESTTSTMTDSTSSSSMTTYATSTSSTTHDLNDYNFDGYTTPAPESSSSTMTDATSSSSTTIGVTS